MKPLAQVNVIPFIDIMLVLLAVVLTTATFVAQGKIPLELPQGTHSLPLKDYQAIELLIDAEGHLYLDQKIIDHDALAEFAEGVSDRSTPIQLRVDAHSAFEHFVNVIDVLKARGLLNVSIITQRPGG